MNTTQTIELARKHLGGAMASSAALCLADAEKLQAQGNAEAAKARAVKSLSYSVGIFHSAYQQAAQ